MATRKPAPKATAKRKAKPPGRKTQRDPNALTQAQELFLRIYQANGYNGTRAYLESHPNCKSYATAAIEAHRTLKIPKVRARLEAAQAERWARLDMKGDEAAALISLSARADIGDAYDENGNLLPVHQWPETLRLAVKGIKPGPYGDTLLLHDGLKARELVAMMTGRLRASMNINVFDLGKYLGDTPPEE